MGVTVTARGSRAVTVAAILVAAVTVGALTFRARDHDPTFTAQLDGTRADIAEDYRKLLDERGLVANPAATKRDVVDLYGSALIQETGRANGGLSAPVHVTGGQVDTYVAATGVPDEWVSWALATLAKDPDSTIPVRDAPSLGSLSGQDDVERATNAWLVATSEPEPTAAVIASLRQLVDSGRGGVVAAWRLLTACEALSLSCRWPGALRAEMSFASIEDVIATRAAAELTAMGVPVDGWDASAAGPPAEAALNAIDDGNELVATSLARIAHVAGTGDEAWNGYLARIAHRLDPGTGVYRLYYAPQGTIANTYNAMMTVVDHFPDLVSGAATATTVRTVVLEDSPNTGLDVDGNGGSGT